MAAEQLILVDEPAERVRRVTLNRPDKRNAISKALRATVLDALHGFDRDPGVRVTIVRGAGPCFSSGYDLSGGLTADSNTLEQSTELLSGDFEAWRTFLHPTQRSVAQRPVFNGPAKVTGGAGTGKTVSAIHRARFLAQQLNDSDDDSSRILVTTYTNSLADNLDRTLRSFCSPDQYRRLQVATVDSFARQTLSAAKVRVRPVDNRTIRQLADDAAVMAGLDNEGRDGRFLLTEWEQVILARGLTTLVDYVTSPRPGRGTRLARSSRTRVWAALEYLLGDLERRNVVTYLRIADAAADILTARTSKPFAHVTVDEAQDLHPAQWRLLRQAVAAGPNDLFIAGDAHQRIYDHRVSLLSLGIDTRGRSRRLKINYRTSQQILGWALAILTGQRVDDLDGDIESKVGYRSALDGPVPTIQRFATPAEEAEFVAAQAQEWIEEGVAHSAIGIAARRRRDLRAVQDALDEADIRWTEIRAGSKKSGVQVGTMHSCKGLEFRTPRRHRREPRQPSAAGRGHPRDRGPDPA